MSGDLSIYIYIYISQSFVVVVVIVVGRNPRNCTRVATKRERERVSIYRGYDSVKLQTFAAADVAVVSGGKFTKGSRDERSSGARFAPLVI